MAPRPSPFKTPCKAALFLKFHGLGSQNLVTVCYKTVRSGVEARLRGDSIVCHERGMCNRHLAREKRLGGLRELADLELGRLRVSQ